MTTLRNDPIITAVDSGLANKLTEQDIANGMGDLRRGWNAGRIANDLNPLLVDQLEAQARGDAAAAEAMAPRIKSLREQQQMYAPRVGRVEQIGGIGDALDWAAGQVGQGAASMADPMAVSAGLGTVGRVANTIPHPVAKVVGGAATAGSLAVPYLMNSRQLAGEFIGNAQEDKELMARTSPQQLRDASQKYGAAAAVLDTALPGILGHQVAGTTARTALGKMPFGAKVAGGMLGEGGTETLQEKGSQFTQGLLNPNRDTSGDDSALLNSFLGGAVGAGPMVAGGALAESGHRRVLDGVDHVKDAAGTVLDLAKDGVDAVGPAVKAAGKAFGAGKKQVVDLGKDVVDSLKEGSKNVKTWAQTTAEEAHILNQGVPEGWDPANMTLDQMDELDQMRGGLVMHKLTKGMEEGDEKAKALLDKIEGAPDDDAQIKAVDEAAAYVLEHYTPVGRAQQRAQGLMRSAGKLTSAGAGAAVKLGREFLGGLKEGNKKNAMGEEAPVSFVQWRDQVYGTNGQGLVDSKFKRDWNMVKAKDDGTQKQWVDAVDYMASVAEDMANKTKGTKLKYGEVAKRMAFSMASAIESAAGTRTSTGNVGQNQIDRMAAEFMDLYGPKAPDAVVQLGNILGKDASPVTQRIVASMQALTGPQGRSQAALRRDILGRDVAAMVPLENRKALLAQGINIEDAGGREALLNIMEDVADGMALPGARAKAVELFSQEGVDNMLGILNDVAVAKNKEREEAMDRGELLDMEGNQTDEVAEGDEVLPGAKHIQEFAVDRAAGDRVYAFHGEKTKNYRVSSERRDPFSATKNVTPEERATAELFGEPVPHHRPTLFEKGQGLHEKTRALMDPEALNRLEKSPYGLAIAKKIEDLEQELRMDPDYPDHDNYRVMPVSVKDAMDEMNYHDLKRVQLFRDYSGNASARLLLAESYRAHLTAQAKKNGQPAPSFSDYRQSALADAWARYTDAFGKARKVDPDLKGLDARTAMDVFREKMVTQMARAADKYFARQYVVRGEKISDNNPDALTPADIMKMHRDGQRSAEAARGTKIDGKFVPSENAVQDMSERNILVFKKNDDTELTIPAGKLVEWVRRTGQGWEPTKGKNGETKADPDKAYLHDVATGVMAVVGSGMIKKGAMPYKVNARGEIESFHNGIPDSLALPNTTYFGYKKRNEKRAERKQAARDEVSGVDQFPKEGIKERLKNGTMTYNEQRARERDAFMVNSRQGDEAVARDQMRNDDFFVADPTEGFADEWKEDKTNRTIRKEADRTTERLTRNGPPRADQAALIEKLSDRKDAARLPDSQINDRARAARAWENNENEPEDLTPLDKYRPEPGDEFSDQRARSLAQKFHTEGVLRGETRNNAVRTAEQRGREIVEMAAKDPEQATEVALTRLRMGRGESAGGLSSNWWHVAPLAYAANRNNWSAGESSVGEMMSDMRKEVAKVLLAALDKKDHSAIKPDELVKMARLMSTDPKKVTLMNAKSLLMRIAGTDVTEGKAVPAIKAAPTTKPKPPQKDGTREPGWYAVLEADDDYGQPTAEIGTQRFATKAEAAAAGDFGAYEVKAAPEVAAKAPKGQPTSSGAGRKFSLMSDGGRSGFETYRPEQQQDGVRYAYVRRPIGPVKGAQIATRLTPEGDVEMRVIDLERKAGYDPILTLDLFKNPDGKWEIGMDGPQPGDDTFHSLADLFDNLTVKDPYGSGWEGEYSKYHDGVWSKSDVRNLLRTLRNHAAELGVDPNEIVFGRDTGVAAGKDYVTVSRKQAWKFNAQDGGPSRIATEAEMKEARAYVHKVLGPKIKVVFKDELGYSGEFIDAENTIVISTTAAAGTMGTTYHEALHAFFRDFVKSDPKLQEVFESVINQPKIVARLQDLLKDHPAALEQLKDGEERLAYTYQFWKAGLIEIDTQQHTIFQKIGAFFRRVFGMVRDSERALEIFTAFDNGKMSEPSAAGKVIAAALQKGTNAIKFRQKYDGLITNLAALVLPSAEVLLQSESPTAQKLGRMLFTNPGEETHAGEPGMLNAKRTEAQRYINEVNRRLESMSDVDRKRVHEYLEQEEIELIDIPLTEDREAVRHIRGVLARFHTYLTDSGMNIGKVKNYFPVVWSQETLMNKRQEFIDMLVNKYPQQLSPINGDLHAAAERIWATLVDKEGVDAHFTAQREDGVLTPFFASQGNRTLSFLSGADRSQFLEKNLPLILTRYFHQGAHSAEYFRRFGEDGVKLDKMLKQIGAELRTQSQRLLQTGKIKDEKARKLWVDRRMREINRSVGAMEGTLGKDVSPAMRKFNSWMTVYQNVRLLPLALFSSLVDPLAIVARGAPLQAAYETLVYGLKEVFAQWKAAFSDMPPEREADAWRDLAEHIGAAEIAVFQHHVSEEYSSSYLTPGAKKINDMMFKLNGMEAWNRGTRIMATKWAVKFLEDHAKGVDPIHSERFLKELGLTKDQVPLNADGKLITTPQELRDVKGITLEQARWQLAPIYDALNRWVEGAVLTPNAAQRPAWSSDPRYSTVFHLKQFTYSFHQTILKRARNELDNGNLKPLLSLALFVPTMIVSDITKGFLQGAGTLPPYMQGMNAGDWLAHGVNRAGLAGIGVIGTDAYSDWASLGGPAFEQIVDASRDGFGSTTVMKAMPVHAMYEHLVT